MDIAITDMRPDLVIWSKRGRVVIIGELTVPWEDNIDERHEFKRAKYLDPVHDCETRGWKCTVFPSKWDVEVSLVTVSRYFFLD